MSLNIRFVKVVCPNCGKKIREGGNLWLYGSPIRTCKKCKKDYYCSIWREVAVEGFDPRTLDMNAKNYAICTLALAGISLFCTVFIYYMETYQNSYSYAMDAIDIICAIGCIICFFLTIWYKLGFPDRANKKYMEESKKRLRDTNYVRRLRSHGMIVPDDLIDSL